MRPQFSGKSFPIYGSDHRIEVYAEPNAARRKLAEATLAVISAEALISVDKDSMRINAASFAEEYGLCRGERFQNQQTAADCTAFLITPRRIATAGHCVSNLAECRQFKFVFGYMYTTANSNPYLIAKRNIYSCRRIIKTQQPLGDTEITPDFAVIELDRLVPDHRPLNLRKKGRLQPGEKLFLIGHPAGLPAKIADGAWVRRIHDGLFESNVPAYGGNSGSPVFNVASNDVEGILVTGEDDFIELVDRNHRTCQVSLHCKHTACIGEDSTPATLLLPYLH